MKTLGLALTTGALLLFASSSLPASAADATIRFDAGNVAFAYTDGYWDHDHHWHKWSNAKESQAYRRDHKENYHAWKHDRDKDQGWHEEAH